MTRTTLKAARLKAKLTQDELAAKSGVDQTTISNLEVGKSSRPQIQTVIALADALGVHPAALRFGKAREGAAA